MAKKTSGILLFTLYAYIPDFKNGQLGTQDTGRKCSRAFQGDVAAFPGWM